MCQMLGTCPDMTLAVERGVKQQLYLLNCVIITQTLNICIVKSVIIIVSLSQAVSQSLSQYVNIISAMFSCNENVNPKVSYQLAVREWSCLAVNYSSNKFQQLFLTHLWLFPGHHSLTNLIF